MRHVERAIIPGLAMSQVTQHDQAAPPDIGAAAEPRPVILATLSVRVDPDAERMAIDTAEQTRARLIIANMLWLPLYPTTLVLAREAATLPHEEDLEEVRATAQRAADRGIATELLRISSRRPLASLIELVIERQAGLVVLGPDPGRTPRWWLRRAVRRVRQEAPCLVWMPGATS